jgi:hypothetical protein
MMMRAGQRQASLIGPLTVIRIAGLVARKLPLESIRDEFPDSPYAALLGSYFLLPVSKSSSAG